MKVLLEDYQQRLENILELLKKNHNNSSVQDIKRYQRLITQASIYRSIIIDIKDAIRREEESIKKEIYLKNQEKKQHLSFDEVKIIWNAGEKYAKHFIDKILRGDKQFDENIPDLKTFYKQNYNNK